MSIIMHDQRGRTRSKKWQKKCTELKTPNMKNPVAIEKIIPALTHFFWHNLFLFSSLFISVKFSQPISGKILFIFVKFRHYQNSKVSLGVFYFLAIHKYLMRTSNMQSKYVYCSDISDVKFGNSICIGGIEHKLLILKIITHLLPIHFMEIPPRLVLFIKISGSDF